MHSAPSLRSLAGGAHDPIRPCQPYLDFCVYLRMTLSAGEWQVI